MAGTLTISTLSDGTNSTSSTNCIQGSAKAWVSYNATTQAIRASYNVSSVTYSGTGIFVINMTNALSDTNYVISAATSILASSQVSTQENSAVTRTASSFGIATLSAGSYSNSAYTSVAVFR